MIWAHEHKNAYNFVVRISCHLSLHFPAVRKGTVTNYFSSVQKKQKKGLSRLRMYKIIHQCVFFFFYFSITTVALHCLSPLPTTYRLSSSLFLSIAIWVYYLFSHYLFPIGNLCCLKIKFDKIIVPIIKL